MRDIFRDINLTLETWNIKMVDRVTEKDVMSVEKSVMHLMEELHRLSSENNEFLEQVQQQTNTLSYYEYQMKDMREELDRLQEQLSLYKEKGKETTVDDENSQDVIPIEKDGEKLAENEEKEMQHLVEQWITDPKQVDATPSLFTNRVTLEVTCEDGRILSEVPISDQDWNREMILRRFYEEALGNLRRECEDSAARASHCEQYKLAAMQDRNQLQEEIHRLIRENHHLTEAKTECQDALETISSNYAMQIQLMSNHVCELNEQVRQLTEELAKYQSSADNPLNSRIHR